MMNTINNFFSGPWVHALGWTLLHSIWQSLIILLVVLVCLRFIPAALSRVRYTLSCAGFFLVIASGLFTFIYLFNPSSSQVSFLFNASNSAGLALHNGSSESTIEQMFTSLVTTIESNMPLIITAWMVGFFIFAMRLFGGLFYTYQLRRSALPLNNTWSTYTRQLSEQLGINRFIDLAESGTISAPLVIGYFKPIILVPAGMLTGLTTEQLETIILHELAHIKRHDFLINLIQSVMETVLFFNPFIWSLSNLIRREREYCCDDLVVSRHGSPIVYARTLAQLEEVRLSKNIFALSLAESKNQLLNRIRRIMEKSVKNYSGKDRMMIPAVLLIAGLLCVSWLSIPQENNYKGNKLLAPQDTTIKKNEKSARYSRKSITTIDKNGQPHEEVTEEFEGDESLRPMMENMEVPVAPDAPFFMPPQPLQSLDPPLNPDTVPAPLPDFGFDLKQQQQWEEFSKAFEDKFREQFEDFYSSNETDLSNMMKELQKNFQSRDWPAIGMESFDLSEETLKGLQELDAQHSFKDLQESLERLQELNMERFRKLDADMQGYDKNFKKYEQALRDQLIKDGYLSENETIQSMEWSDDSYKVNGVPLKDSDKKTYKELHDKYLGKSPPSGKVE